MKAVILAGGVGSRFWPFSRELEPKQFMKLIGQESLLQATIQRLKGVVEPACVYIITNKLTIYATKSTKIDEQCRILLKKKSRRTD